MTQEKSRSIWELLSDVFREMAILLWVFGVLLEHDHKGFLHGVVVGIGGMLCFVLSLMFEVRREKRGERRYNR